MSSDQQPDYVWDFGRQRKQRRPARAWLIVALTVLAIAIAAVLFWVLFRPGASTAERTATPSASSVGTMSPSATPSPSVTPTLAPTPTPTPTTSAAPTIRPTPPRPTDPDLASFRDEVGPVLDAAATGLRYAREEGGMAAMQDVMLVQQDAERLTESVAPSAISERWSDALATYGRALETLRAAYERGDAAHAEDRAATAALSELNDIAGR
ncbi:hypothetical protein [Microbacterium sp.]|uniref:hypothetical protein n=1 Tax=Microbacterium sp. TaxID=51671 RepID=UPI002811F365|nr:hypothetical protein [Microbacterium sp.]